MTHFRFEFIIQPMRALENYYSLYAGSLKSDCLIFSNQFNREKRKTGNKIKRKMEDFAGLENGQKFRNDADESKWAKLISTIKEKSLRFGSKLLFTPDLRMR